MLLILNPTADIITFKMNDLNGNSFKDYPFNRISQ